MANKSQENLRRIRAYDEDVWRTIRGAKVLIDGDTGVIKGGAGGKFNGQKVSGNVLHSKNAKEAKNTKKSRLQNVTKAFGEAMPEKKVSEHFIRPHGPITPILADRINKATTAALKEVEGRFDPAKDKLEAPIPVKDGKTRMSLYPELQKKYDEIRAKEPQITNDLMEIVKSQGGKMQGIPFRIKAADSLERKIKKNIADPEKDVYTPEEAIDAMGDVVRYTVMASSHDKLGETSNNVVAGLKDAGYHIIEVDNKWKNPTKEGYRGVHLEVVTPDWSQHFELQIHSDESIDIKQRQHPLYELTRKMSEESPTPLRNELKRVSIEMGMGMPEPKGIEKLESRKNKNWRENHQDVV